MAETTTTRRTTAQRGNKWLSGLASLFGAWIVVSPWVLGDELAAGSLWNNVIIGAAIFLIAGYNYYRLSKGLTVSVGGAALVALLGLWMIIAPFLAFEVEAALLWSNVISGIAVAGLSGYNAYAGREAPAGTATEGV